MSRIDGLPFEQYLALPALSKSKLASLVDYGDQDDNPTQSMKVGSLVDCLVFEPKEFLLRYYVTEVTRRGTKEWKAAEEIAMGKEIIKAEEYEAAELMALSLREHDEAKELLTGDFQVTLTWKHEATGIECKARPDCLRPEGPVDLKTSCTINPYKFAKQAAELRYHWQDVWYCEGVEKVLGIEPERMRFVVVDKKAVRLAGTIAKRHPIGIFKYSDKARAQATIDIDVYRHVWANCQRTGEWPKHETQTQIIDLPKYMEE